jgi:hypothetical protein
MKKLLIVTGVLLLSLVVGWVIFWWNSPFRQRAQLVLESRKAWATPIAFYGKVVDENGVPVEGTAIRFQVTDLSATGVSEYHTMSDSAGLFTLTGVTGKHLGVFLSREGYYTPKTNRTAFEYAAGGGQYGIFAPDPKNPIIFQLRKKGVIPKLIRGYLRIDRRKDGGPIELNLITGKVVPEGEGHIRVENWSGDLQGGRYDWRCRLSIPEGGLVEATAEFSFEAPLEGYRPFDEIEITVDGSGQWKSQVERKYWLKLRDGNYALLRFIAYGRSGWAFIADYYLNPTGSRNLEHDPRSTNPPGISTAR